MHRRVSWLSQQTCVESLQHELEQFGFIVSIKDRPQLSAELQKIFRRILLDSMANDEIGIGRFVTLLLLFVPILME